MDQPTIVLRISSNVIAEDSGVEIEDPLAELVSVETVVNSTPAINRAMREFVKRHRPVKLGKVRIQRV